MNITKFFVHNFTSLFSVVIVYKAFLIVFFNLQFEQCSAKSDPLPTPKAVTICKPKPISAKVIPMDKTFLSRSAPSAPCGYGTVVDMFMLERTAVC